jgi:hypothetical protein
MSRIALLVAASALCALSGSYFALAQVPAAQAHPMSFFVTSAGMGKGANLGGLAGADAYCQALAAGAGAGNKTWHAYLSTQARPGQPAVNARDRIGTGPWYNAKGEMIASNLAHLHGDTLELARMGNNITKVSALTEKGAVVPGLNDGDETLDRQVPYLEAHPEADRHEILTGSTADGRAFTDELDHTCNNWTSEAKGSSENIRENKGPAAYVGLSDRNGGRNGSWNSSHGTTGCGQTDLARTHGAGMFYCFAIN